MGSRIPLQLLCVLLVSAAAASAETSAPVTTGVVWTAPAECPDHAALVAEIERLLGEAVLQSAHFTADAQVKPNAELGFELELHFATGDGSGTRRFQAADCRDILRLAAFSIALAVDPTLRIDALPPSSAPREPSPTPSAPAPELPVAEPPAAEPLVAPRAPTDGLKVAPAAPVATTADAPPAPPPKARDGLWLGAQFVGDTALMPRASTGLSLWGHRSWSEHALRLGLGAKWLFPQSEALPSGAGGEFSVWLLELRGCYGRGNRLQLALCPTLAGGVEHGQGIGVDNSRTQQSWFLAPGLALLGVARPSARWISTIEAEVLFPFPRDEFVLSDGPIHELPAVSLQVSLGLGVLAY